MFISNSLKIMMPSLLIDFKKSISSLIHLITITLKSLNSLNKVLGKIITLQMISLMKKLDTSLTESITQK